MKPFNIIITILASLMVTVMVLSVVEYSNFPKQAQVKVFGEIQNLGALKFLIQNDWSKGLKTIGFLLFYFFAAYLFFYLIVFLCATIVYFIISSKWRKPSVFISYKNTDPEDKVNTTKIAQEVKAFLEKHHFKVYFFEYNNQAHHDDVNYSIQAMLEKSDCMVVVPDPEHPSYVDAEIFYASGRKKPIFIIKHSKEQRLPNTANSGHTVFVWQKLKKEQLKPMSDLLCYVHKTWNSRLDILWIPLASLILPVISLVEESNIFVVMTVSALIIGGLVFLSTSLPMVLMLMKLIVGLLGAFSAYTLLAEILKKRRLQKTTRQEILNKGNAYEEYQKAGFKKQILDCIDKVGLQIRD